MARVGPGAGEVTGTGTMDTQTQQLMRRVPSVDAILKEPELEGLAVQYGRKPVADAVREAVATIRQELLAQPPWRGRPALASRGHPGLACPDEGIGDLVAPSNRGHELAPAQAGDTHDTQGQDALATDEAEIRDRIVTGAKEQIEAVMRPFYRRAVNATGIILHTGLGRAVLPAAALAQIQQTLGSYSLLQVDRQTGKRSRRDERIEWLLQRLTGAEAATVVNNNAAATAIVLNTVAKGKEVIVSRGQLVEIGGSFRLPDVMAFSGARLVEVGTTNKTHPRDYENAFTENTAAILRVHPSNYKIQGFSAEVPLDEMAAIAHRHNLVMIDDVGAGALLDFSQFGFEPEPMLADSIRQGADLVTCSADKLIGASQGGLVLGRKSLIEAVRKNQFARIVRVGKLTLAVLEATLKLFLDESLALREVPTLRMLRRSAAEIREHAERLAAQIREKDVAAAVATTSGFSEMGSGSLPAQNLATTLVAITPQRIGVDVLAQRLRRHETPVFARIQNDQVLLDPRTLRDGDDEIVIQAVAAALAASE
ncbi:MAG: L-seryl-tRNA(Sec) selenium transferase [Planctomycetes bacterium]|nr:L-seryl-tRNA(Sec) selenium transferase [Planctomycetota bacterium]